MKIYRIILLVVVLTYTTLADGIPVDKKTKRIRVPHTIIRISENQVEEIEAIGTLTLTNVQWKQLRNIGPNCPKRFENVLPITWNDCTCDMSPYVIQISRDSIAVLHNDINGNAGIELRYFLEGSTGWVSLSVDHRGQFYFKGILIPFENLLTTISTSTIKESDNKYEKRRFIFIHKPLGMSEKSPQLESRLNKLFETAKQSGLSIPNQEE
jgi:hypothetical protein